jgi:hypothetical protein
MNLSAHTAGWRFPAIRSLKQLKFNPVFTGNVLKIIVSITSHLRGWPASEHGPTRRQYLENMQGANSGEKPLVVSSDTILLQASEQYKRLPSTSPQRIDIVVLKKEDQKPLSGFESTLDLLLPDGSHYTSDISAHRKTARLRSSFRR